MSQCMNGTSNPTKEANQSKRNRGELGVEIDYLCNLTGRNGCC